MEEVKAIIILIFGAIIIRLLGQAFRIPHSELFSIACIILAILVAITSISKRL